MCGHVGIAGALETKDENTLKRLLMFDYFRGPDSTGVAVFQKDGTGAVAKIASNPVNLFDSTRFKILLNGFKSKAFIGHNRAATKGAVNDFNAHPYECGHILGAHNGTLSVKSWDKLQELIGEKTGTDSHAIFLCIEKFGIEETVKHLQGAWALVWIDTKENTLNFLRNKERPFWYAYTADFKKVIWASEHWMIRAAVSSAPLPGYSLFESHEKDSKGADVVYSFFSTGENWHYKYDLDELAKGSSERPKARVKKLEGKEPEVVSYTSYGNFPQRQSGHLGTTTTTTSTTSSSLGITNTVTTTVKASYDQPFGIYMNRTRFNEITKFGCSWCYEEIHPFDVVTIYDKHEKVLCPKCSKSGASGRSRLYMSAGKMTMIEQSAALTAKDSKAA